MYNILKVALSKICLIAFISIPIYTETAYAHSGGLNAQGCHGGSRPYHCHRDKSEMVGRRLKCDLGSRSSSCGQSNKKSNSVKSFQNNLMRHCNYLPEDFSDGIYGKATLDALLRFQKAYGLTPDGKYGPETEKALSGPVSGKCK